MVLKRNTFLGILVIVLIFFILIVFYQRNVRKNDRKNIKIVRDIKDDFDYPNTSLLFIKNVVKLEEASIKRSLYSYRFPSKTNLQNFTLSSGGTPIRSLILTTWRSGSTLLGDVINAMPGNFYHYEPLLDYGIIQIRGPPYSESALTNLKSLLNCDYSKLGNYLEYGKTHTYSFTHNTRLWSLCEAFPKYCFDSTFLSNICKLFPFQLLKTVRLRLRLVEDILKDTNLNVKVVLLVRDPRGIIQSRKHEDWCSGEPDCDKPNILCADMVSDYSAAIQLQKLYPQRLRVIRYEDLSLYLYDHVRSLFKFLGLYFHHSVKEFLDSHSRRELRVILGTARNLKATPFDWKMDLNFSEVQYIEENCDEAMQLWGYIKAINGSHIRDSRLISGFGIDVDSS